MKVFHIINNISQNNNLFHFGIIFSFAEHDPTVINDDLVSKANQEKWSVWSLQGGLQTLTDRLEKRLQDDGVEICTGQRCSKIEFTKENNSDNKVTKSVI